MSDTPERPEEAYPPQSAYVKPPAYAPPPAHAPPPGYASPPAYPPAPPAPVQYAYQPVYVQQQSTTNGLAIASMVLGIIWLYWVGSILAVIFGHIALHQIKQAGGRQSGRGMAIAGVVLGYIGIAILIVVLIVGLTAAHTSVTYG